MIRVCAAFALAIMVLFFHRAKSTDKAAGEAAWLDVAVPTISIDAKGWWEVNKQLAKVRDRDGNAIPIQIYTLGEPEDKNIQLSLKDTSFRTILGKLCAQSGLVFALYQGIAVVGTDAELRHFDAAFLSQAPVTWKFGNTAFRQIQLLNATSHEVTAFFNKKLDQERVDHFPIDCLGHANHPITFNGYNIGVAKLLSVIAADIGVPVIEVFAEKRE